MRETRAKKQLRKLYPGLLIQRVETSSTQPGTFDSNIVCYGGVELWMEFKQLAKKRRKAPTYKIPLRSSQYLWAVKRLHWGAKNLFLALMIGSNMFIIYIRDMAVLDKIYREELTTDQIKELAPTNEIIAHFEKRPLDEATKPHNVIIIRNKK